MIDINESVGKFLTRNGYTIKEIQEKWKVSRQALYMQRLGNVRIGKIEEIIGMEGIDRLLDIRPERIYHKGVRIKDIKR